MIRRTSPLRRIGGYSMVILMMAVTFMTIFTARVLPEWSAISQREKEEELIFRGLQYAEAIRVFQRRFGRYPVRLEELYEVKPRCIRQLYPDPMTENGSWGLIYAGGPGTQAPGQGRGNQNQPGQPGQNPPTGLPESETPEAFDEDGTRTGDDPGGLPGSPGFGRPKAAVGPITGVVSKGTSELSFKVFMDQEAYDQWAFTVDLVSGVASAPDRPPQVPSARTLGRPFPEGITPLITFAQPNQPNPQGQGPNGRNRNQIQNRNSSRGGFGVPQPAQPSGRGNQDRKQ